MLKKNQVLTFTQAIQQEKLFSFRVLDGDPSVYQSHHRWVAYLPKDTTIIVVDPCTPHWRYYAWRREVCGRTLGRWSREETTK